MTDTSTPSRHSLPTTPKNEVSQLIVLFWLWKSLLLSVVFLAPGPGYDTSSTLLLDIDDSNTSWSRFLALKFLRWDAVYYTEQTRLGYATEQEWAFGPGYPASIGIGLQPLAFFRGDRSAGTATVFQDSPPGSQIASIVLTGTVLSCCFHLLSVLLLYNLAARFTPPSTSQVPYAIALLHTINPAGVFLTAPYSEALFAAFSTAGIDLYFRGLQSHDAGSVVAAEWKIILAGLNLGIATVVRSNGVLNGAIFLYDALFTAVQLLQGSDRAANLRRLFVLCVGGSCIGIGLVLPQLVAYERYCLLDGVNSLRPWCGHMPPSIYTWVQDHYWYELAL